MFYVFKTVVVSWIPLGTDLFRNYFYSFFTWIHWKSKITPQDGYWGVWDKILVFLTTFSCLFNLTQFLLVHRYSLILLLLLVVVVVVPERQADTGKENTNRQADLINGFIPKMSHNCMEFRHSNVRLRCINHWAKGLSQPDSN